MRTFALATQLRPALAPRTVAYILRLARQGAAGCPGCRFYRAEGLPAPGAVDNYGGPGPPYALLQGSFASPDFVPIDKESAPLVARGDACFIGSGPDFFLAVGAHPEWGQGHTVWGRVLGASMAVVDAAAMEQPKKEETWGQTHVTVLVTPLPFTLSLEEAQPA
jgi:cyclophilin family peptidyl-prolyl cis-trans isomerase